MIFWLDGEWNELNSLRNEGWRVDAYFEWVLGASLASKYSPNEDFPKVEVEFVVGKKVASSRFGHLLVFPKSPRKWFMGQLTGVAWEMRAKIGLSGTIRLG